MKPRPLSNFLTEIQGCDPKKLEDTDKIRDILKAAVKKVHSAAVADAMNFSFHTYSAKGISMTLIVTVIAETYLSFNIWPKHDYATLTIISDSSNTLDSEKMSAYITRRLRLKKHKK